MPRAIAHLIRGALGCLLAWRVGSIPQFQLEGAVAVDEVDAADDDVAAVTDYGNSFKRNTTV